MKTTIKILLVAFLIFPGIFAGADAIDPRWMNDSCPVGHREILCEYETSFASPSPIDECIPYKNNPKYISHGGMGSTLGGEYRYCEADLSLLGFILNEYIGLTFVAILTTTLSIIGLRKLRRGQKDHGTADISAINPS